MAKKIYLETHGCSANFADSEIMAGLLKEADFELVGKPENADLIILNTCNVKTPTSNKMINRIKFLAKFGKPLIIAGCMPKTERERIEKISPNASLIGPDSILKIVEAVEQTLKGKKVVLLDEILFDKLGYPRIRKNPVIGIVPIASGCLSYCTYCITRFSRGRLRSYPEEKIIEEIKRFLKEGAKEIWITSQDNSVYGFDKRTNLANLLNKICKIDEKFFVRVGMMNPSYIKFFLNELIEAFKCEKIFKFIHIPVQSGSNRILTRMKRGYTREEFLEIVEKFKKEIRRITISTDVIVGFPGETDEDFEETIELIKEVRPDIVNISKFGARPGTEAAKLKQLSPKIVKKRTRELYELVRKIQLENNKKWINWEGEVLIDEIGTKEGTFVGRNFAYKPIVVKGNELLGKFVKVKVEKALSNYLLGILIKD